jgi:hypothetical protein
VVSFRGFFHDHIRTIETLQRQNGAAFKYHRIFGLTKINQLILFYNNKIYRDIDISLSVPEKRRVAPSIGHPSFLGLLDYLSVISEACEILY